MTFADVPILRGFYARVLHCSTSVGIPWLCAPIAHNYNNL